MIYLRIEQIGGDPDAIQLYRKPIATFFLWATGIEILSESQRFDWQSDITRHRYLELWDRIHLTSPAPAAIYLDAFFSYVDVDYDRVTEYPGSEEGARVASLCLLRALSGIDPTSATLEDIHKSYVAVIPRAANFDGLRCYHAISAIHAVLVRNRMRRFFDWANYKPRALEHIFFANTLARVVRKREWPKKVPRWLLRFVIHSISYDPQPPVSIAIDCLTIIAADLGCDVSHPGASGLSGRYARL